MVVCALFLTSMDLSDPQAVIQSIRAIIPDLKPEFITIPITPDMPPEIPIITTSDKSSGWEIVISRARMDFRKSGSASIPESIDVVTNIVDQVLHQFRDTFALRCNRFGMVAAAHVDLTDPVEYFQRTYMQGTLADQSSEAHLHILKKENKGDHIINIWTRLKASTSRFIIELDINTAPETAIKGTPQFFQEYSRSARTRMLAIFEAHTPHD